MAKDKISDYSSTANSNTDIAGINIDEGCAPSGINDAIRTLMAQLKTWQSGGQDVYIHPAGSASAPSITANGDTNTGIFFPAADTVGISTGGTERARVDSSGNLGLGVTPSAWSSTWKTLNLASAGNGVTAATNAPQIFVNSNSYFDGTNWKYGQTGLAGFYTLSSGVHSWHYAASGTAGNNITFTQAMTLDASGNLGIGTTSPSYRLDVAQAGATTISSSFAMARITGANSVANDLTLIGPNTSQVRLNFGDTDSSNIGEVGYDHSSNSMRFVTNGSERIKIDSSGNLLVGTTATINAAKSVISFSSSNNGLYLQDSTGVSGAQFMRFDSTSSTCGSITRVTTTSAVTYNTTSDYRLKTLIGPVQGSGERIDALNPVEYSWTESGTQMRGFFAHEFKDVYNHSVNGEKDQVDDNGNPVYQSMQAGSAEVIADLVAEIKSLRQRVAALEA